MIIVIVMKYDLKQCAQVILLLSRFC